MKATKILWFSRHTMTDPQRQALENKLGPIQIHQVDRTIQSAFELQEEIKEADIIAIVAPINLQQQFLRFAGDKPVIMAISRRELVKNEDGTESKAVFIFERWERLEKIEVITSVFAE